MRSIRYGLLAGALAGLLLVAMLFFDEGPTNQLIFVAQAFGLDGHAGSKGVAALLMLALGAIIGMLFGAFRRQPSAPRGRALLWGAVAGIVWWAVLFVFLGLVVRRLPSSVYLLMLYLAVSLVYGLVLGSVYTTLQRRA
ncbi:MAG TPA: DUF6789 family protein [Ktedonobacterales bacterium]|jgi:hypothetical protein